MRKTIYTLFLVAIFLSGCNFAGAANPPAADTSTPEAMSVTKAPTTPPTTEQPTPVPPTTTPAITPTDSLSASASATSAIFPVLTISTDTICRAGPDKHYYAILKVTKGKSFDVSGRSADGLWVSIDAPKIGDDCWVPVSSLETPGDLSDLNVRYTQPLPGEPMNVTASDNACGTISLWLYWKTVDAVGYRIYRNGKEIATVYGSKYRDLNTPRSKLPTVYLYEVESFNASGTSPRAGISVTLCG